jgi:hypothetical protein
MIFSKINSACKNFIKDFGRKGNVQITKTGRKILDNKPLARKLIHEICNQSAEDFDNDIPVVVNHNGVTVTTKK